MFSCIKKETKHLREKYRSKGFYVGVCSHSATKNSLNFSIPMVKIREALPEYRALAPSSEPISPKAGLELKPRLSNSANILGDTWLLADFLHKTLFFSLLAQANSVHLRNVLPLFFFALLLNCFATPNPPINLKLCYLYRDLRAQCDTTSCWVWEICWDGWYL